ncbi:MAG: sulfite reductase subunit A [Planctomycetota bacterium]|nr:MAG: sulfite reductase subunit A [Planctomycetota bacterium]
MPNENAAVSKRLPDSDGNPQQSHFVATEAFASIFEVLQGKGYTVIGPTIDQHAIVYDQVRSLQDLPQGWTDRQGAGEYRLERRDDNALFGYVVGPHSWKHFLFPPAMTVATADKTASGWTFQTPEDDPPKYAFLGVRACELAAMRVQDRVFMAGPYVDPAYHQRRSGALIIAVNCSQAAPTCFCTSMGTGPQCTSGFDLALTELTDGFVIAAATRDGEEILSELKSRPATVEELRQAAAVTQRAAEQVERRLDTTNIRDVLFANLDHPRWDDVAQRCLSCANCTMVCPTCFCSSVQEVSDLSGQHVERQRQWDSCFNFDFSYMNGGVIRDTTRSRYRQWLTHKLASWIDQFGSSGCVGCGRCIAWCPVGIDLTEEVAAIREPTS